MESKQKLALFGVAAFLAWVAITIGSVIGYNEFKAHGQEHAYIKQMMGTRDHEALAEIIKYLQAQEAAKKQQP